MRSALAYAPGNSALHRASALVAISFLGAFALVAFVYSNPLVLVADAVAVVVVGLAAGARRAVATALRLAAPLLVLMTLVNALVYHRGDTTLLRGWEVPVIGSTDITLESLAAGASIGLRVVAVILAFAVYSACVNPDRVLRAIRPIARRSTLTAALVVRMVPVAAGDAARMREAAELRGPAAEPVGRVALMRRLVEGSIDRAIDVAATLELRGHSLGVRPIARRERYAPAGRLIATAVLAVATSLAGLLLGAGSFETYPRIEIEIDPATLALCAVLPLLAAIPFAGGRRA